MGKNDTKMSAREWRMATQPEFLWVMLGSAFAVGVAVGFALGIALYWA